MRVIAATNRDLEKAVAENSFRRDLYFRLHVVEIFVPPLRKRAEDIIELANYFLDRYNAETGRKIRGFTPEAMHRMQQYRWPGNVRELKNVIERAVVLARSDFIDVDDLHLSNLATAGESGDIRFAQEHVRAALARRHREAAHPRHAQGHRLEQEPHRGDPRRRALHARPQNPPLRPQAAGESKGNGGRR